MTAGQEVLVHALDLPGRVVVTLGGEDVAQLRDVLFARSGAVVGFTLAGRGLLAGPMRAWLPWAAVHGFGPDAVVVPDDTALEEEPPADGVEGDVIGDEVLTRSGTRVGEVIDAVLRVEDGRLDLVGYEVEPSEGDRQARFLPLPDTLSVTPGRLVVPDAATDFLTDDLAGFGAAVDTFRARLREAP